MSCLDGAGEVQEAAGVLFESGPAGPTGHGFDVVPPWTMANRVASRAAELVDVIAQMTRPMSTTANSIIRKTVTARANSTVAWPRDFERRIAVTSGSG